MDLDLNAGQWALLALGAAIAGVSKTALPGSVTVAVALFATVLPARESTATLLLLLLVGDAVAMIVYRRHVRWDVLLRLVPTVLLGIVAGALYLAVAHDTQVRRVIGVVLLLVVGITVWHRFRPRAATPSSGRPHPVATLGFGSLGGFTTMVANTGGPIMTMYFLAARFPVYAFLGTTAWFFATVNVIKLPFAIGIGLITPAGLFIDLVLAPVVVASALAGRLLARRMSQAVFDGAVIVLTLAGAVLLIV